MDFPVKRKRRRGVTRFEFECMRRERRITEIERGGNTEGKCEQRKGKGKLELTGEVKELRWRGRYDM